MSRLPDFDRRVSRRGFAQTTFSAGIAAAVGSVLSDAKAHAAGRETVVHRHDQVSPFPVNAYIVEGREGLVVVDATLTNTSSRALRQKVDDLGKPLQAVLLTHPHPDHYAGLGNLTTGLNVPIVAVEGVNAVVRRDDAAKDAFVSALFGDEWPKQRVFPNQIVKQNDSLDFGPGLSFKVIDIGPAESFYDSLFTLEGASPTAFIGDLAFSLMHAYMADNENPNWVKALDRVAVEFSEDALLYVGHGLPVTRGFLAWQQMYLRRFDEVILATDWSNPEQAEKTVAEAMKKYLPSDDLLFLMQLSIKPNAKRLGKI